MAMIGKKLSERAPLRRIEDGEAIAALEGALEAHARPLVEVRAQGAQMIACLVLRADAAIVRLCKKLELEVRPGGTLVFGLEGADAARLFGALAPHQRSWLAAPCAPRETKVLLLAAGFALLSIDTHDRQVRITAAP